MTRSQPIESAALLEESQGVHWLSPRWSAPPSVQALSTLRRGGVSQASYDSLNLGAHVGDGSSDVSANRELLKRRAQLPAEPVWLTQVHGTHVVDLDVSSGSLPPQGDAAITRTSGRVCAILTADCLPVLFAARDASVVGAAHAGWRGLAAGVLEATIDAMQIPPSQIIAWLGPAIGPAYFEVGAEVRAAFVQTDPLADAAFTVNARGRYLADLWALARHRLARAGLTEVSGGGICTYARGRDFYSHRRDAGSGRQATLIWLR